MRGRDRGTCGGVIVELSLRCSSRKYRLGILCKVGFVVGQVSQSRSSRWRIASSRLLLLAEVTPTPPSNSLQCRNQRSESEAASSSRGSHLAECMTLHRPYAAFASKRIRCGSDSHWQRQPLACSGLALTDRNLLRNQDEGVDNKMSVSACMMRLR